MVSQVYNPLANMQITSAFGPRKAFATSQGTANPNHSGVDLRADTGTKVYSPVSGTVTKVVNGTTGFGKYVDVKTEEGYTLRFAHLSGAKVAVGQKVSAGQVLALSGASGNVTGAHLHFGVYDTAMKAIDPLAWLEAAKEAAGKKTVNVNGLSFSQPIKTATGYQINIDTVAGMGQVAAAVLVIGAGLAMLAD